MKISKLLVSILVIILSGYGCNNSSDVKTDSIPITTANSSIEEERELKKKVIAGDTLSYLKLRKLYISNDKTTDFLVWAMLMSNKYNFESSHYDVFFCLQSVNMYYGEYSEEKKSYLNTLDSLTNSIAKSYLLKMSNKKIVKETLATYYKDTLK